MRRLIISFNTHTHTPHTHTRKLCAIFYIRDRGALIDSRLSNCNNSFRLLLFTLLSTRLALRVCVLGVCANIQWCLTFNTMLRCISPRDETRRAATPSATKATKAAISFDLDMGFVCFQLVKIHSKCKARTEKFHWCQKKANKQQHRIQIYVYICIPKIFIHGGPSQPREMEREWKRELQLSWQSRLPNQIFYTCFTLNWRNF